MRFEIQQNSNTCTWFTNLKGPKVFVLLCFLFFSCCCLAECPPNISKTVCSLLYLVGCITGNLLWRFHCWIAAICFSLSLDRQLKPILYRSSGVVSPLLLECEQTMLFKQISPHLTFTLQDSTLWIQLYNYVTLVKPTTSRSTSKFQHFADAAMFFFFFLSSQNSHFMSITENRARLGSWTRLQCCISAH